MYSTVYPFFCLLQMLQVISFVIKKMLITYNITHYFCMLYFQGCEGDCEKKRGKLDHSKNNRIYMYSTFWKWSDILTHIDFSMDSPYV